MAKLRLKGEDARRKLKIAFPDLETLDILDTEPAAEDPAGEAEAGQEEEKPDKAWVVPVVPKGPKKKRPVQKLPVEEEEESDTDLTLSSDAWDPEAAPENMTEEQALATALARSLAPPWEDFGTSSTACGSTDPLPRRRGRGRGRARGRTKRPASRQ